MSILFDALCQIKAKNAALFTTPIPYIVEKKGHNGSITLNVVFITYKHPNQANCYYVIAKQ